MQWIIKYLICSFQAKQKHKSKWSHPNRTKWNQKDNLYSHFEFKLEKTSNTYSKRFLIMIICSLAFKTPTIIYEKRILISSILSSSELNQMQWSCQSKYAKFGCAIFLNSGASCDNFHAQFSLCINPHVIEDYLAKVKFPMVLEFYLLATS